MSIYESLGLGQNAFAFGQDDLDPGQFINHLDIQSPKPDDGLFRQLIGERGAGKSTHLMHWSATVGGTYYYVQVGDKRPKLPLGPLVYWDEADRIKRRLLYKVLQAQYGAGATVVVGTHEDLTPVARDVGFRVENYEFAPVTTELASKWANTHIDRVSIGETRFEIPAEVIAEHLAASDGTLRDLGTRLHIWLAKEARRVSRPN